MTTIQRGVTYSFLALTHHGTCRRFRSYVAACDWLDRREPGYADRGFTVRDGQYEHETDTQTREVRHA